MQEALEFTLDMDAPDKTGVSNRSRLEHVLNTTQPGTPAYESANAQLEEAPEIPHCVKHVWNWFWELNSSRTFGMNGPNPITFSEIQAWNKLTQSQIRSIEITLLRKLDEKYLRYSQKKREKK